MRYEFIEKRPIIYLDESGFAVDAPREKGYSPKGEKCYASKDWHAKGRVNVIGAITKSLFKFVSFAFLELFLDQFILKRSENSGLFELRARINWAKTN